MSKLILQDTWQDGKFGDVLVWENPPELGHAFIKLRKQQAESRIIERIFHEWQEEQIIAAIMGSPYRPTMNWRILATGLG